MACRSCRVAPCAPQSRASVPFSFAPCESSIVTFSQPYCLRDYFSLFFVRSQSFSIESASQQLPHVFPKVQTANSTSSIWTCRKVAHCSFREVLSSLTTAAQKLTGERKRILRSPFDFAQGKAWNDGWRSCRVWLERRLPGWVDCDRRKENLD